MNKLPFAITLEVGSSHANRTGSWRVERPVYVERMPPCNNACPAGENIQRWLYDAEPGDYEAAWRQAGRGQPASRRSWAVSATTPARPPATGRSSTRRSVSTPLSASWATWQSSVAGRCPERARHREARARHRGRALGSRVPPTTSAASATRSELVDAAPKLGGMMRYGIPAYRLPRAVLEAEVERIVALGIDVETQTTRSVTSSASAERVDSTRSSSPSAPSSHVASRFLRATPRTFSTRYHSSTGWPRTIPRYSADASPSTAAGIPRSTRHGRHAGSVRPMPSSSIGATESTCLPTETSSLRPSRRA